MRSAPGIGAFLLFVITFMDITDTLVQNTRLVFEFPGFPVDILVTEPD